MSNSRAQGVDKSSLILIVALAAAGFGITIGAFYPGLLSVDSIAQYEQALAGTFSDHHPPLMAWLWSRFDRLVRGPPGMLVLHSALIWCALWLFADGAARRGIRHAWLLVVAGLFPPIIGIEGMIWKDVGMAAALLFATAILYRASAGGERIGRAAAAISLAALFYAMAIRSNAPAAAVPIVVYWVSCVLPRASPRIAVRLAIGVFGLLLVVQWGIDARLLHARRVHITQVLENFDLAAIQCAGGDATIPAAFMRQDAAAKPICATFDPTHVDFLYFFPRSPLEMTNDRGALRELGRAWRHAVVTSPGEYLAHRFRVFYGLLGFDVPDAQRIWWQPFSIANVYGFSFAPNVITDTIGAGVVLSAAAGFYNGLAWLVIAFAVAIFAWRNRHHRDAAGEGALAASAICYTLPYFFVALAPDYRYIYWTVVATAIAALLTLLGSVTRASAVSR